MGDLKSSNLSRHLIQLTMVLYNTSCFLDSEAANLFMNVVVSMLAPPRQEKTRGLNEACSLFSPMPHITASFLAHGMLIA